MSHVDDVHAGEREAVLEAIGNQAVELDEQPDPPITCPCGTTITLSLAFRCLYCDVRFCRSCAEDHFGEEP